MKETENNDTIKSHIAYNIECNCNIQTEIALVINKKKEKEKNEKSENTCSIRMYVCG